MQRDAAENGADRLNQFHNRDPVEFGRRTFSLARAGYGNRAGGASRIVTGRASGFDAHRRRRFLVAETFSGIRVRAPLRRLGRQAVLVTMPAETSRWPNKAGY